jgi:hypothetical protein
VIREKEKGTGPGRQGVLKDDPEAADIEQEVGTGNEPGKDFGEGAR